MRKRIVAGNWKMNNNFEEADDLIAGILDDIEKAGKPGDIQVVLCPPALYLELATDMLLDLPVSAGAQNVSQFEGGAYTGEISAQMLASMDVEYCITGHSERRKYFNETDEQIAQKVNNLLGESITPIFCCGEQLHEREAGNHFKVVHEQLSKGLFHLKKEVFKKIVIAYEPVWAIGTGVTATSGQAQEMHAFLRGLIRDQYDGLTGDETTILYGGSCNSKNAADLFANPDVDGGLIGGASLKPGEFMSIVRSFHN